MNVTVPNLIRAAGLSSVVAGAIFAAILPIRPPEVLASVNTSSFVFITSLKTVMSIFGLLGITGLYARQVEKTGWLGLAGYLLLTSYFAVQMCISFIEPTVLPLLTSVAPAFVESALAMRSGTTGSMNLGALQTVYSLASVLFLFGLLLFGIATFRARILPRGAAALLALSGPLAGILFGLLPPQLDQLTGIPTGIALAWLGLALLIERRASASEANPGRASFNAVQHEPGKVAGDYKKRNLFTKKERSK
jgi:hypothetical protein